MKCYAVDLRKENLTSVPADKPGYYKWWAKREDLEVLLKALNVDFDNVSDVIETDGEWYCIYVGVAIKESIRDRLKWHIMQENTESAVKSSALSTFRASISSLVAGDQRDTAATNEFIDRLMVEYYPVDLPIKSDEAQKEIEEKEKEKMESNLRILNIKQNYYEGVKEIVRKLKKKRKESK